jgi:hypothetical protein
MIIGGKDPGCSVSAGNFFLTYELGIETRRKGATEATWENEYFDKFGAEIIR